MLKDGDLRNPSRMECKEQQIPYYDDAKFHDVNIGPNMHQINSWYIRPTTQRKDPCHGLPCLSYALHCNSLGLHCDLFISHAWSEGVFELCNTVNQSWPDSCVGAYICSLANPQNLPELMSQMIQTPSESPFFRVLLTRPKDLQIRFGESCIGDALFDIGVESWKIDHQVAKVMLVQKEAYCAQHLQISMSVVGDPEHLATNRSASHSVTSAILRAVAARRRELALLDAAEDAAMEPTNGKGFYHQRFLRWQKRAERQTARAVKRMKRALDVRKANCSCPEDGEIGDVDQINSMLCELILKDQLRRVPAPDPGKVKLTWYPGGRQESAESLRRRAGIG
eukprot:symbB.v1.2.025158.t2/scaffold2420.1/size79610/2